ncbi:MAG TPA: hypothetical protein VLN49_12160, partial [Gemmatimonadaceae bacterium]|nr:hypothetical protein [Gemmatimonadaceae bacterium]
MSDRHTRREFMGITTAGIAGLVARPLIGEGRSSAASAPHRVSGSQPAEPDVVVLNAKVYTMDPAAPRAEAFATSGGRFVAVGRTADIRGLVTRRSQTIDAKGMTVVPGFIDCHNHAGGATLLYEVLVGNPFEVEFVTIASIVDKLRA